MKKISYYKIFHLKKFSLIIDQIRQLFSFQKIDSFVLSIYARILIWLFNSFFFFFPKSLLSSLDYRCAPRLMFAVIGQFTFFQEIDSFNFATHSPRQAASFSFWKYRYFCTLAELTEYPPWIYRGHLSFFLFFPDFFFTFSPFSSPFRIIFSKIDEK